MESAFRGDSFNFGGLGDFFLGGLLERARSFSSAAKVSSTGRKAVFDWRHVNLGPKSNDLLRDAPPIVGELLEKISEKATVVGAVVALPPPPFLHFVLHFPLFSIFSVDPKPNNSLRCDEGVLDLVILDDGDGLSQRWG